EEPVQPCGFAERTARLGHQLGADPGPTQTGNGVALLSLHVAGTSSKTSYRVTALRSSASRLNRMKAAWSSEAANSMPACWHARVKAWRPECFPRGSVI